MNREFRSLGAGGLRSICKYGNELVGFLLCDGKSKPYKAETRHYATGFGVKCSYNELRIDAAEREKVKITGVCAAASIPLN